MSALALSFFTAADTTIETKPTAKTKTYTAGKFDSVMMLVLMVVIGGTSLASFGQVDSTAVQDGIESFSHYHE
jgi:uncharacterized protein HemX